MAECLRKVRWIDALRAGLLDEDAAPVEKVFLDDETGRSIVRTIDRCTALDREVAHLAEKTDSLETDSSLY